MNWDQNWNVCCYLWAPEIYAVLQRLQSLLSPDFFWKNGGSKKLRRTKFDLSGGLSFFLKSHLHCSDQRALRSVCIRETQYFSVLEFHTPFITKRKFINFRCSVLTQTQCSYEPSVHHFSCTLPISLEVMVRSQRRNLLFSITLKGRWRGGWQIAYSEWSAVSECSQVFPPQPANISHSPTTQHCSPAFRISVSLWSRETVAWLRGVPQRSTIPVGKPEPTQFLSGNTGCIFLLKCDNHRIQCALRRAYVS